MFIYSQVNDYSRDYYIKLSDFSLTLKNQNWLTNTSQTFNSCKIHPHHQDMHVQMPLIQYQHLQLSFLQHYEL